MHLLLPNLPTPIPVAAYFPVEDPQGEALLVHLPANDPKPLGLMPGVVGELVHDDASRRRVRIGKRWSAVHQAGDLRIDITTEAQA